MAKKSFSGGLNTLLGDNPDAPKRGRPKTSTKKITKTSQEGTKENETRATFIVNESDLDKLKAIAYWDRIMIKDIIGEAIKTKIERWEKKNGPVKKPKK